jgi:hypothetical protein
MQEISMVLEAQPGTRNGGDCCDTYCSMCCVLARTKMLYLYLMGRGDESLWLIASLLTSKCTLLHGTLETNNSHSLRMIQHGVLCSSA